MVSFGCCINNPLSPVLVEALALRKLLFICWELQIFNVIFEDDYLQVITAANNPQSSEDELTQFFSISTNCFDNCQIRIFNLFTVMVTK